YSRRPEVQLLAHMSHELKNPLGAVLGFAHLMATDGTEPLSGAQRRRVDLIEQACQHMLAIITGALHESTDAAAGEDEDTVDLGALVVEALQWMQPTAERYGVELSAEPINARVHGGAQCI